MSDNREKMEEQVSKATKLQDLILDNFIALAESGTLSPTDRATIVRMLMANGWSLDVSRLPESLRSRLTSDVAFDDGVEGEEAVPRLRAV